MKQVNQQEEETEKPEVIDGYLDKVMDYFTI